MHTHHTHTHMLQPSEVHAKLWVFLDGLQCCAWYVTECHYWLFGGNVLACYHATVRATKVCYVRTTRFFGYGMLCWQVVLCIMSDMLSVCARAGANIFCLKDCSGLIDVGSCCNLCDS